MRIVTSPIMFLRTHEKRFLEDLREMCESSGCADCPLQNVCDKHFNNQSTFEDFLDSILDIVQVDKE